MGLLRGAADLGLSVQWRFGFVGYGQKAETTPGVVFLDVGGCLQKGVLDHHEGGTAGSTGTAGLVFRNPELVYNHLLGPWLEREVAQGIPNGTSWRPTLVVHSDPDWDALVAVYLCQELIENGSFPPWAEALASYTQEVDQGHYRLNEPKGLWAIHLAYLAIQFLESGNEEKLGRGLLLLRRTVQSLSISRMQRGVKAPWSSAAFHPETPGAMNWVEDPDFRDCKDLLHDDQARFIDDDRAAKEFQRHRGQNSNEVLLPAEDGGEPIWVKAWIAKAPTTSDLNKYWARKDCPFTIIPVGEKLDLPGDPTAQVFPRVILSLDPTYLTPNNRKPSLRGLGHALEKIEREHRQFANNGIDPRGGPPRYPDGYCECQDPWYDGRGHDFLIVDSPRHGTCLTYGTILDLVTQTRFWETKLIGGQATLIWVARGETPSAADSNALPMPHIPTEDLELSETLDSYFEEMEVTQEVPILDPVITSNRFQVVEQTRSFPQGTCGPATLLTIRAKEGATLEGLLRTKEYLVARRHNTPPDMVVSWTKPVGMYLNLSFMKTLIKQITDNDIFELPNLCTSEEQVFVNHRTLVIHSSDKCSEASTEFHNAKKLLSAGVEILLYTEFLSECLIRYSKRIASLVHANLEGLVSKDAAKLRMDVLLFQTKFYQLEVSAQPRNRQLFRFFQEALDLRVHLDEVQTELGRLADLETRAEAQREQNAAWFMNAVLVIIGFSGLASMVVSLVQVPASIRNVLFWSALAAIFLAALGVIFALAWKRGWRPGSHQHK